MAEPTATAERYLRELAALVPGSRRTRRRLLAEIGDHLEDATRANHDAGMRAALAEQRAVEHLGPPAALAQAWHARCARLRRRRRGRGAMLVVTAAIGSILAAAQHADGRRDPAAPPSRPAAVTTRVHRSPQPERDSKHP